MRDVYMLSYSVKGIKTLDQTVALSFYKKTITNPPDTQEYNIKGIYGTNGSGKSGIVSSVDILRNILTNSGYLMNPLVQRKLDAIINKKTEELSISTDYLFKFKDFLMYYRYEIILKKDFTGRYGIFYEKLSCKNGTSKNEKLEVIYEVNKGEVAAIYNKKDNFELSEEIKKKTLNLLSMSSMGALCDEKILAPILEEENEACVNEVFHSLFGLYVFGKSIHVYIAQVDTYEQYFVNDSIKDILGTEEGTDKIGALVANYADMNRDDLRILSSSNNIVSRKQYEKFEENVHKLYAFLYIFKKDLLGIEIDRKEIPNGWSCDLIMVYKDYKVHAEFESTGIKKLIKLYAYLIKMVDGGIVFIDEFDSNLHDVYLCALLEYLMEYGEGQLCFTTHNVGPMDVLKQNKKSIDFLSENHKIYPWRKSGNYSPSKLYRDGMIEGSPFNVDSIDFIGTF